MTAINEQLDAGVDLLEGLLVKKAGSWTPSASSRASTPARPPPGSGTSRRAPRSRRASARCTRRALTLARLGREAPIAVGNPAGPALRDVERGSLAARLLYPEIRQSRPGRCQVAGHRHRFARPVPAERAARRNDPDEAEIREKGPVRSAAEGIVPAEAGGSDAPRDAGGGSAAREHRPGSDDRIRRACDRERNRPERRRRGRRNVRRWTRAATGSRARPEGRRSGASSGRCRSADSKDGPTRRDWRDADTCGIRVRARDQRRRRDRIARSTAPERGSSPAATACPMMKLRLANPEHLIDINDLAELRTSARTAAIRDRA